jgi:hypothetical protein
VSTRVVGPRRSHLRGEEAQGATGGVGRRRRPHSAGLEEAHDSSTEESEHDCRVEMVD